MFCPKCGMRLTKTLIENGEKFDICVNGHKTKRKKPKKSFVSRGPIDGTDGKNFIEDTNEQESIIRSVPCPFCQKRKAVYIRTFTFHADEGEIFLMKCLSCGKNFRTGSGDARGS